MEGSPDVDALARLRQKTRDRDLEVAVVGLGYVGLPLAARFAASGFRVVGVDVDEARCAAINRGESPVSHVFVERLDESVAAGRLRATTSVDALGAADVISICVPTPLSKFRDPDLTAVMDVAEALAARLRRGQLVVLESTTYPGTTEEVLLPLLERSGLRVGVDFHLGYAPERIDPGREEHHVGNTPRVVGGVTAACRDAIETVYGAVIDDVVPVSSPRAAEMVKMLENSFRSVNVALVNEVALMCDRLDIPVFEVVDAAATKPYGFMSFRPGPGLGGHCLPIDPRYLSWKMRSLDSRARFIELAEEVNRSMPAHVVAKVVAALNRRGRALLGARVTVLGVAYKRDVDDVRESPAIDIIDRLARQGASVCYHDPLVPHLRVGDRELSSRPIGEALDGCHCAVVVTDHSDIDFEDVARRCGLVVDARGVIPRTTAAAAEVITL